MRWDPTADPYHDAIYASAARLRSSGAHSYIRHESHRLWRATATSGRFLADRRSEAPVPPKTDDLFLPNVDTTLFDLFRQLEAVRHHTRIHIAPKRYD